MIAIHNYIKSLRNIYGIGYCINALGKIQLIKKIYQNFLRRDLKKLEDETFNELMQLPGIKIDQQVDTQNASLVRLLSYANDYCPYYRELFSKQNISVSTLQDFKRIPYLDKKIIKQQADKILSTKIKSTEVKTSNTGGSTGEPFEFYTDSYSGVVDDAHHKYLYHLIGYKKGDIIVDSGGIKLTPQLIKKNIYWVKYPKEMVWGHWGFSALYLNKNNIRFYIDKIVELKPSIFRGYPSFFNELSLFILENKIMLNFNVKGLNLTAEFCSNEQRKNIEKAFGSKVYLEYGQSEKTVYCYSDGSSYFYKSSPIYGYVEVLNDKGEDVLPGEEGEIIVTSLCSFTMPFIRYRTADRAILKSKHGGIVELETILGRTQDFIFDKNNQKIYLTALIFGQHFKAFKNIFQWQIVQKKVGFIEMNIVKGPGYSKDDEKEIIIKIKTIANINLRINYVGHIEKTRSGKQPFLIQKLKNF